MEPRLPIGLRLVLARRPLPLPSFTELLESPYPKIGRIGRDGTYHTSRQANEILECMAHFDAVPSHVKGVEGRDAVPSGRFSCYKFNKACGNTSPIWAEFDDQFKRSRNSTILYL